MTDVVSILKSLGAIVTDNHFVYTTERHGSVYIRKDQLYPHTQATSDVCMLFARKFKDEDIDVVVGPQIGGIILSQWTAYHLSKLKGKEILGLFTEKDDDNNQLFKRGYDELAKGKNVLIVEDLTTTGSSVKKVAQSVEKAGGKVKAICVMINRDPQLVNSQTLGYPFSSLGIFKAESFAPDACSLCEQNIPVNTTVGHGKKFLQKKGTI